VTRWRRFDARGPNYRFAEDSFAGDDHSIGVDVIHTMP
jgi:hypothetical protein